MHSSISSIFFSLAVYELGVISINSAADPIWDIEAPRKSSFIAINGRWCPSNKTLIPMENALLVNRRRKEKH